MTHPTDAELEAMARDVERYESLNVRKRAAAMLRACKTGDALDHAEWDTAIEAAAEACTNVIKSYDVMDATGTKYLPMTTQKAAKGMVSIAREDIWKLKKGPNHD